MRPARTRQLRMTSPVPGVTDERPRGVMKTTATGSASLACALAAVLLITTAPSAGTQLSARSRFTLAAAHALGLTTHVPTSVTGACAKLAHQERTQGVRRIVFCPPLVPSARPQVIQTIGGADGSDTHLRTGYLVSAFSPACGSRDGSCHWTFAAGPAPILRGWVYPPAPLAPPGQRRLKPLRPQLTRTRLDNRPVTIYRMPLHGQGDGGLYDSHIVVQWELDDTTFQISMHGYENRRRAEKMAAAMIREIEGCSTKRQRRESRTPCRLVLAPSGS